MNKIKIGSFLIFTFGISWLTAFLMYFNDIKYGSITSLILIGLIYMPSPAIATIIVQKFFYSKPLSEYGLSLKNISIKYLLLIPVFYFMFIVLTLILIYVFGNILEIKAFGELSFENESIVKNIQQIARTDKDLSNIQLPFPFLILVIGILSAIFSGASFNMLFALGEELGWRGLLLNETELLGFWYSNLFIGLFWGLWHMPIIFMGHNYPNYPFYGSLMMILFCITLSFLHSIVKKRARTIYAPAALHGMINAGAPVTLLFITNNNELVGSVVGIAGILAGILIIIFYMITDKKLAHYQIPSKRWDL